MARIWRIRMIKAFIGSSIPGCVVAWCFIGCVLGADHRGPGAVNDEDNQPPTVVVAEDLHLVEITPGLWRHVSYTELEGFGRSPANGLLIVGDGEAALIDTPWTNEQTRTLFAWVREAFDCSITTVVATHSHGDNLGGLKAAHELGARSYALDQTARFARNQGKEVPQHTFPDRIEIRAAGRTLELRYLGAGHTVDNIVVWIPEERVLFGGCLVRSAQARSLGYTAEADLVEWPETIEAVREAFPAARIIVPGHGRPGGTELLDRTLELLANRGEREEGMRYLVARPHKPIKSKWLSGKQGARFTCQRKETKYPGWIWCISEAGTTGWVPEAWISLSGDSGTLLRDYDALELTVEPGEQVEGELTESGWALVVNGRGQRGWVPIECLTPAGGVDTNTGPANCGDHGKQPFRSPGGAGAGPEGAS